MVQPNMSMSLQEILERFTRGESLDIGKEPSYDDGDEDLEKMAHMDLVDRQEYANKLKKTQKDFEKQERKKAADEKARLDKLAVDKLVADKKAGENPPPSAK